MEECIMSRKNFGAQRRAFHKSPLVHNAEEKLLNYFVHCPI